MKNSLYSKINVCACINGIVNENIVVGIYLIPFIYYDYCISRNFCFVSTFLYSNYVIIKYLYSLFFF